MLAPPALTALAVAGLAAGLARGGRALTWGGAAAAWAVGTAVLVGTGWGGGAILAAFFLPSTLVSRAADPAVPSELDAKGGERDAAQVLANGGVALLAGLLALRWPGPAQWMLVTSLSAAAADTWATSVGERSGREPRGLLTGSRVPVGTSGAVSGPGSVGALAGAAMVAVTAWLLGGGQGLALAAVVVGMLGMLTDSLLGATLQGRFHCGACGLASEHRMHRCGTPTRHQGGLRWLDNDGVNLLSTLAAGLAGAGLWWLAGQ